VAGCVVVTSIVLLSVARAASRLANAAAWSFGAPAWWTNSIAPAKPALSATTTVPTPAK
jgi:uncharacterized membrane protein YccF (DUF307 family)